MTGSGAGLPLGPAAGADLAAAELWLAGGLAAGAEPPAGRRGRAPAGAGRWRRWRGLLSGLGSAPRPRTLSVAERLDLGPKRSLWLVACGARRFLVAGGAEAVSAVHEVAPEGPEPGGRIPVVRPARWMAER